MLNNKFPAVKATFETKIFKYNSSFQCYEYDMKRFFFYHLHAAFEKYFFKELIQD